MKISQKSIDAAKTIPARTNLDCQKLVEKRDKRKGYAH
jgi:hypothetical protein